MAKEMKAAFRARVLGGAIEFDVKGASGWRRDLTLLEKRLGDMRPVFEKFGGYQIQSTLRTHAAQGRPAKWQPLALSTQYDRARQGYPAERPILERSGKLMRSYDYSYTKTVYRFDNLTPYFIYHQKGGSKIPRRIMIQLLAQDKAQFTRYRSQYLAGAFGGFG